MRARDIREARRAAQERDHANPYAIDEEADEHDGWAEVRERQQPVERGQPQQGQ